jgi:DNA-binding MarR family transcriptional regulator
MELTSKQIHILTVILKKNPDGRAVDLDQILSRLPYETTKDSLHFSLRALIKKGLIEKGGFENRRGERRRIIQLSKLGESLLTIEESEEYLD